MSNIYTKKYLNKAEKFAKELKERLKVKYLEKNNSQWMTQELSEQIKNQARQDFIEKNKKIDDWLKETQDELKNNKNWFLPPNVSRITEISMILIPLVFIIFLSLYL